MKIEPLQVLGSLTECAEEIVNENPALSKEALIVMKLMMQKVQNKLFKFEIMDMNVSEEELNSILYKPTGENDGEK